MLAESDCGNKRDMIQMKDQTGQTSTGSGNVFAHTLAEQEIQLHSDPQLQAFRATRQACSDDTFRPRYHFANADGCLNDPNGLCRWQGRWHLFYQAFPPRDPRPHWAHAVSEDEDPLARSALCTFSRS